MGAHETSKQRDARFEAESDVRTLVQAEEIKKNSKRMAAAMKMATEQKTALEQVRQVVRKRK